MVERREQKNNLVFFFFVYLYVCVCVWSTTARFLVQKCVPRGRVRTFRSSGGIPVVYLTRTQKKKIVCILYFVFHLKSQILK